MRSNINPLPCQLINYSYLSNTFLKDGYEIELLLHAKFAGEVEEDGKDLTVEALLNTPSTAVGTLLHLATKVGFHTIIPNVAVGKRKCTPRPSPPHSLYIIN